MMALKSLFALLVVVLLLSLSLSLLSVNAEESTSSLSIGGASSPPQLPPSPSGLQATYNCAQEQQRKE